MRFVHTCQFGSAVSLPEKALQSIFLRIISILKFTRKRFLNTSDILILPRVDCRNSLPGLSAVCTAYDHHKVFDMRFCSSARHIRSVYHTAVCYVERRSACKNFLSFLIKRRLASVKTNNIRRQSIHRFRNCFIRMCTHSGTIILWQSKTLPFGKMLCIVGDEECIIRLCFVTELQIISAIIRKANPSVFLKCKRNIFTIIHRNGKQNVSVGHRRYRIFSPGSENIIGYGKQIGRETVAESV